MKKIPKAVYQTRAELEQRIRQREADADAMLPGTARQSILVEIAQLRAYAGMKRWVEGSPSHSQSHALSVQTSRRRL